MYDQIISPRTISSSIEMPESGYNNVSLPSVWYRCAEADLEHAVLIPDLSRWGQATALHNIEFSHCLVESGLMWINSDIVWITVFASN